MILMKKLCNSLLIITLVLLPLITVSGQDTRGVGVRKKAPSKTKRIALVIGNGNYQFTSTLDNPVNDATDMTAALKSLGFEVISGTNQSRREMQNLIRRFGNRLADTKGVGLFFYAGHGVAAAGVNYLIPVDADIQAEDEIDDFSISMNFLLGKLDSAKNGFNMIILDACRNNPFARSWRNYRDIGDQGGLARVNAPTGTLIAYATKPGDVASDGDGRNGLYTSSLLKQMKVQNVDVTKMLQNVRADVLEKSGNKQVPFDESSLVGDFYFAGRTETPANDTISRPKPVSTGGIEGERAFWNSIKDSEDSADFQSYLDAYPQGVFAPVAKNSLRKLRKKDSPPKKTENTGNTNPSTGASNRPSGVASLAYPAKTSLAMYNAAKNKDMKGFKRVFSKDALAFVVASGKESGATLEDALKGYMNEPLPATFEWRNEIIKGNRATLEGLSAKGTWELAQFVKEGNEWKLSVPPGTVLKNSIGMSFAYIPPGIFQMGATYRDKPGHQVRISEGYWMGTTEVTQEQWQKVMGNNPSNFKNCGNCPVERVSWNDVQGFIRKLNSQSNDGSTYRLPTEAEWENAARAGTGTTSYLRAGELEAMAWYMKNSEKKTHAVGTKQPNGWGLYDMHGNVREWMQDWWGTKIGTVTDPTGPTLGSKRVSRGGGFNDGVLIPYLRDRYGFSPYIMRPDTGFRLVRTFK